MESFGVGKSESKKKEAEEDLGREIENFTSMKDEERKMRAHLTGAPIPADLREKRRHFMFLDYEDSIIESTKNQLTAEGYKEGRDGIWKKPFFSFLRK